MKNLVAVVIGVLMFAVLTGINSCSERYELVVYGRVADGLGQVLRSGRGAFCYQQYAETAEGAVPQGKRTCVDVSFGSESVDGDAMSFVTRVQGSMTDTPLRMTYEVIVDDIPFDGTVVRQEGIHRDASGVYRGKAVLEFYPAN